MSYYYNGINFPSQGGSPVLITEEAWENCCLYHWRNTWSYDCDLHVWTELNTEIVSYSEKGTGGECSNQYTYGTAKCYGDLPGSSDAVDPSPAAGSPADCVCCTTFPSYICITTYNWNCGTGGWDEVSRDEHIGAYYKGVWTESCGPPTIPECPHSQESSITCSEGIISVTVTTCSFLGYNCTVPSGTPTSEQIDDCCPEGQWYNYWYWDCEEEEWVGPILNDNDAWSSPPDHTEYYTDTVCSGYIMYESAGKHWAWSEWHPDKPAKDWTAPTDPPSQVLLEECCPCQWQQDWYYDCDEDEWVADGVAVKVTDSEDFGAESSYDITWGTDPVTAKSYGSITGAGEGCLESSDAPTPELSEDEKLFACGGGYWMVTHFYFTPDCEGTYPDGSWSNWSGWEFVSYCGVMCTTYGGPNGENCYASPGDPGGDFRCVKRMSLVFPCDPYNPGAQPTAEPTCLPTEGEWDTMCGV